jgi:hypothetical protein
MSLGTVIWPSAVVAAGLGVGSGAPTVGIWPAETEMNNRHVSPISVIDLFILISLVEA